MQGGQKVHTRQGECMHEREKVCVRERKKQDWIVRVEAREEEITKRVGYQVSKR